jgi:hypothetical protein
MVSPAAHTPCFCASLIQVSHADAATATPAPGARLYDFDPTTSPKKSGKNLSQEKQDRGVSTADIT